MSDREQIRARVDAATPGPWEWEPPSGEPFAMEDESLVGPVLPGKRERVVVLSAFGYDESGTEASDEDRAFIAHARTDIPYLLAEVDRLEAAHEGLHLALKFNAHAVLDYLDEIRDLNADNEQLRDVIRRARRCSHDILCDSGTPQRLPCDCFRAILSEADEPTPTTDPKEAP